MTFNIIDYSIDIPGCAVNAESLNIVVCPDNCFRVAFPVKDRHVAELYRTALELSPADNIRIGLPIVRGIYPVIRSIQVIEAAHGLVRAERYPAVKVKFRPYEISGGNLPYPVFPYSTGLEYTPEKGSGRQSGLVRR